MRHTCSSQGGVVAKTSAEGETGRFWWTFILTTYTPWLTSRIGFDPTACGLRA